MWPSYSSFTSIKENIFLSLFNSTIFKITPSPNTFPPKLSTVSGIYMVSKLVQFENAWSNVVFNPDGSVIYFKFVHLLNVYLSIVVTLDGIITYSKLVQF